MLHCPYCHGWEVRDQAIGVLATGPMSVHQALLFRQLSDDVMLFAHTAPAPADEEAEQLAARGIAVVERRGRRRWRSPTTGSPGCGWPTARWSPREALAVAPRMVARAGFLRRPRAARRSSIRPGSASTSRPTRRPHRGARGVGRPATSPTCRPGRRRRRGRAAFAAAQINADLVAEETRLAVAAYRDPFSAEAEARLGELAAGDRRHGL